MGPEYSKRYGVATVTATHITVQLIQVGGNDFAVSADWTPVAGDVKVTKNGGSPANIGTLPTYTVGLGWVFIFTAAELTCKKLDVLITDATTKAVEDQFFTVGTFGHASAMVPVDISHYPNGYVYYDGTASNTNTVMEVDGIPSNPVSDEAAAIILAVALGTKKIHIRSSFVVPSTMNRYELKGDSSYGSVSFNSQHMQGCMLTSLNQGGVLGTNSVGNQSFNCTFSNNARLCGQYFNCILSDSLAAKTLYPMNNTYTVDCIADDVVFDFTSLDAESDLTVMISRLTAKTVTLQNLKEPDVYANKVIMELDGTPDVIIAASCDAGVIVLMGFVNSITDSSTGTCAVTNQAVAPSGTTPAAVWAYASRVLTAANNITSDNSKLNVNAGVVQSDLRQISGSATVDGRSLTAFSEALLAMARGDFREDIPVPGQTTVYKQDKVTPLLVFSTTTKQRILL